MSMNVVRCLDVIKTNDTSIVKFAKVMIFDKGMFGTFVINRVF